MNSCVYAPRSKLPVPPSTGDSGDALSKEHSSLQVGARWAQLLRQHYGTDYHAFKKLSQDFRCDARTAKAWLAGQKPDIGQLARAARLFGATAVAAVLHPEDRSIKSIQLIEEIDQLKQRLRKMQQLIGEFSAEGTENT